jgi:dihydroneopterin triphosphate diphosphatase
VHGALGGQGPGSKIPQSVLVVIYSAGAEVLLLERADHPGFWQSVTGSKDSESEPASATCHREVMEETGLDTGEFELTDWQITNRYEIYAHWRHRYPAGVTHNTEQVFGLRLPAARPIRIALREHLRYAWLPWEQAAGRCFSWSNAEAIRQVPARLAGRR